MCGPRRLSPFTGPKQSIHHNQTVSPKDMVTLFQREIPEQMDLRMNMPPEIASGLANNLGHPTAVMDLSDGGQREIPLRDVLDIGDLPAGDESFSTQQTHPYYGAFPQTDQVVRVPRPDGVPNEPRADLRFEGLYNGPKSSERDGSRSTSLVPQLGNGSHVGTITRVARDEDNAATLPYDPRLQIPIEEKLRIYSELDGGLHQLEIGNRRQFKDGEWRPSPEGLRSGNGTPESVSHGPVSAGSADRGTERPAGRFAGEGVGT